MRLLRRVRVGTANLEWGMTHGALVTAGRKLGRRLDVFGTQELRSAGNKAAVRAGLPAGSGKPLIACQLASEASRHQRASRCWMRR